VRARKAAMGLLGHETFVAQSYQWGGEAQVDWYEGWAEFDGEGCRVASRCEGCYTDFAGSISRVVGRLGEEGCRFLTKGSCCAENPLHVLWPLRIGLPARLP
jgi:hypothetical protein